jgi:hypothetical protein
VGIRIKKWDSPQPPWMVKRKSIKRGVGVPHPTRILRGGAPGRWFRKERSDVNLNY